MNETDRLIDEYVKEIMFAYRDIETELIYKVAKLWAETQEIGGSLEYFLNKLEEFDVLNNDTLAIISKITGKPLSTLKYNLQEVGFVSVDNDLFKKAYNQGVISKLPSMALQEKVIQRHIKALEDTFGEVQRNVTSGVYRQTYQAIKKAQLSVELGTKSSGQAIIDAVKDLADKGIYTSSYLREGKEVNRGMEATVRLAVRTSFIETVNDLQEEVAEELGTEHWYVTQHLGARTTGVGFENHAQWQGKVYTDEEMVTKLGEGHESGKGFGGYNCRHRKIIHIPGVSVEPPPTLDMDELERVYVLQQTQRRMERDIRNTKRAIHSLEIVDNEESQLEVKKMKKKLRNQQKRIREHIEANKGVLRRDYTREKVILP